MWDERELSHHWTHGKEDQVGQWSWQHCHQEQEAGQGSNAGEGFRIQFWQLCGDYQQQGNTSTDTTSSNTDNSTVTTSNDTDRTPSSIEIKEGLVNVMESLDNTDNSAERHKEVILVPQNDTIPLEDKVLNFEYQEVDSLLFPSTPPHLILF